MSIPAMTAFHDILYFVYDKDQTVNAIDLTDPTHIPPYWNGTGDMPEWEINAIRDDDKDRDLVFREGGHEGMTFAEVKKSKKSYVFVAVDQKKKAGGKKKVARWDLNTFWKCFEEGKSGEKKWSEEDDD